MRVLGATSAQAPTVELVPVNFAFHVPGDGIVFGQDGRLTSAADDTELAFSGRSVVNVTELCAALAP